MPGGALAAVGSIGGALIGAHASGQAADTAAAATAHSQEQQLQYLREGGDAAIAAYAPYIDEGDQARALTNPFFGIYTNPEQARVTQAAALDTSSLPTLEDVLREQHPTDWAQWQKWESKLKPSSYTKGHRAVYGNFEGYIKAGDPGAIQRASQELAQRRAALSAQNQTQQATQAQTREQDVAKQRAAADRTYAANPIRQNADKYISNLEGLVDEYGRSLWGDGGTAGRPTENSLAGRATTKANADFKSMAAADGGLLSGRTARGLQENEAYINDNFLANWAAMRSGALSDIRDTNDNAFNSYMSYMNGIADRGASASNGVANAKIGQGTNMAGVAQSTGNTLAAIAQNRGNATVGAVQGVANTLGYLGGQYMNRDRSSGYTPISTNYVSPNLTVSPVTFPSPVLTRVAA